MADTASSEVWPCLDGFLDPALMVDLPSSITIIERDTRARAARQVLVEEGQLNRLLEQEVAVRHAADRDGKVREHKEVA
jgi:hypothetical protein